MCINQYGVVCYVNLTFTYWKCVVLSIYSGCFYKARIIRIKKVYFFISDVSGLSVLSEKTKMNAIKIYQKNEHLFRYFFFKFHNKEICNFASM